MQRLSHPNHNAMLHKPMTKIIWKTSYFQVKNISECLIFFKRNHPTNFKEAPKQVLGIGM